VRLADGRKPCRRFVCVPPPPAEENRPSPLREVRALDLELRNPDDVREPEEAREAVVAVREPPWLREEARLLNRLRSPSRRE
jgi:hypothetical protein